MRKSLKRRSKKQRGGDFFSSSNTSYPNPYSTQPSGIDYMANGIKNAFKSASDSVSNTYNSVTNSQPSYTYSNTYTNPDEGWWEKTKRNFSGWFSGGTRRVKRYNKKGGNPVGYPDLSLATDVNGIKVAEPTYWIKGGKRRVSKRRRHHK